MSEPNQPEPSRKAMDIARRHVFSSNDSIGFRVMSLSRDIDAALAAKQAEIDRLKADVTQAAKSEQTFRAHVELLLKEQDLLKESATRAEWSCATAKANKETIEAERDRLKAELVEEAKQKIMRHKAWLEVSAELAEARQGEAEADKLWCELSDKLGGRNLLDEQTSCIERIRDLIAAEGEMGDLRAELAETKRALGRTETALLEEKTSWQIERNLNKDAWAENKDLRAELAEARGGPVDLTSNIHLRAELIRAGVRIGDLQAQLAEAKANDSPYDVPAILVENKTLREELVEARGGNAKEKLRDIDEARRRGVCRVCGIHMSATAEITLGSEHAHTACLEKERAR